MYLIPSKLNDLIWIEGFGRAADREESGDNRWPGPQPNPRKPSPPSPWPRPGILSTDSAQTPCPAAHTARGARGSHSYHYGCCCWRGRLYCKVHRANTFYFLHMKSFVLFSENTWKKAKYLTWEDNMQNTDHFKTGFNLTGLILLVELHVHAIQFDWLLGLCLWHMTPEHSANIKSGLFRYVSHWNCWKNIPKSLVAKQKQKICVLVNRSAMSEERKLD